MDWINIRKGFLRVWCCCIAAFVTFAHATQVGNYVSHTTNANMVTINTGGAQKVRITVCTPTIVRVEFDPRGTLSDNFDLLNADFMTKTWSPVQQPAVTDNGTTIEIATANLIVQVQKSPLRIKFLEAGSRKVLTGEDNSRGMAAGPGENPWLQLTQRADEHYFGWGQAYGWFKDGPRACDKKGQARIDPGTEAPLMYSTGGYGVFLLFGARVFDGTAVPGEACPGFNLQGNFARYQPADDYVPNMLGYYFIAGPGGSASVNNWREIIDGYTRITGRPQLVGKKFFGIHRDIMEMGGISANEMQEICDKFRDGRFPMDVVRNDQYFDWGNIAYAAPVNGYWNAQVPGAINYWKSRGFTFGGMMNGFGFRGCCGPNNQTYPPVEDSAHAKIAVDHGFDYAWYDAMAFQSRTNAQRQFNVWKAAHGGDESKVWVAKGWFSMCSQSFAACHTGDGLGNPNYVVIPAHLEQSLVGYAFSYTDLGDGSAWNYVGTSMRPIASYHWAGTAGGAGSDWKVFDMSTEMQQVLRKWARLHYQFIPYFFTYNMIAHETGMPIWRHMVCHDPQNSAVYNKDRQAYVGEDIIVSPYYGDGDGNSGTRSGIYLPDGVWYDYFEGTKYVGPTTINYRTDPGTGMLNYKLPMFVRAGAVIPLMPEMQYVGEKAEDPITLRVWPSGSSSFTLFEDETPVKTTFRCDASTGQDLISIPAFGGSKYSPATRKYQLEVYTADRKPQKVARDNANTLLTELTTKAAYDAASSGWFYDAANHGTCYVKPAGDARNGFSVIVSYNGTVAVSPRMAVDLGLIRIQQNAARNEVAVSIPFAGAHAIELLNARGQVVRLVRGSQPQIHSIPLDRGSDGMYLLRVSLPDGQRMVKRLLAGM